MDGQHGRQRRHCRGRQRRLRITGLQVPHFRIGYTVNVSTANLLHPAGWTATVRVKLLSGGDIAGQATLQVIDGRDRFDMYLCDGTGTIANGHVGPASDGGDLQIQRRRSAPRLSHVSDRLRSRRQLGDGTAAFYIDARCCTRRPCDAMNNTNIGGSSGATRLHGQRQRIRWPLARFELGQRPLGFPTICASTPWSSRWELRRQHHHGH